MKNQWIEHLKKVKKENPKLSFKERVKLAQKTYKKKGEEETKDYITREEFNKFEQCNTLTLILWAGLIFIIPVFYSLTANTNNVLGFYGMIVAGFFCIGFSIINYFKWRKRYGKKVV